MKETQKIVIDKNKDSAKIAKQVAKQINESGAIILLSGDYGVGKTYFAKNIAKELGFKDGVCSPSFVLCKEYAKKKLFAQKKIDKILHFDLYRLKDENELKDLNILSEVKEGNLLIIEWPDLIKNDLNKLKELNIIEIKIVNDEKSKNFFINFLKFASQNVRKIKVA